jgi:segregation and condensation protein B
MNIKSIIESLLFVANKPASQKELAQFLQVPEAEIDQAVKDLSRDYEDRNSGLQIVADSGKYQIVSCGANSKLVQEFLHEEVSGELSRPSLEALTIIAYRGPISKLDLDRIRGVNCALIIRNLLVRGLIEEVNDELKKEIYYQVSLDFMRHLGISKLDDLPDYLKLHADDTLDKMLDS